MRNLLLSLILLVSSGHVFASALVCKRGSELIVHSNLIFYGGKASDVASSCAQEIHNLFNQPDVKLKLNGKSFKVKFKISYQVEKEEAVFSSVNINERIQNNYIRVEDKANNEPNGRSNHNLKGNCGFYAHADNLGKSTTCAHEYAHGLGLTHYDERKSGYGSDKDLRGTGTPGIMAARGFLVDKKFQWNQKAKAGEPGGTINPVNRIVRPEDILDLNLEKLTFDKGGCARLGVINGYAFTKDGKQTKGDNSHLSDAVNYIGKILSGDVADPIYCE